MNDDWPPDSLPASSVPCCWLCDGLELWQTMTGQWRCMRCDRPKQAIEFWSYQKRQAVAVVVEQQLRRDWIVRDAAKRVAEFFGEEAL